MLKLYDCCWVDVEGRARAQLVIRKRLKPAIYAMDEWLYWENGQPVPTNPEAPRLLAVAAPIPPHQRRGGRW